MTFTLKVRPCVLLHMSFAHPTDLCDQVKREIKYDWFDSVRVRDVECRFIVNGLEMNEYVLKSLKLFTSQFRSKLFNCKISISMNKNFSYIIYIFFF